MTADQGDGPSGATPRAVDPGRVSRRRLYYVAGFDPASPKKYHRMFKAESALQGALTGARYEVGELRQIDEVTSGWTVRAEHPGGARVEVDYRFLHWFDLVRAAWPKDDLGLFLGACRALKDYYASGLMARAKAEAPAAHLASLTPVLIGGLYLVLYALVVAVLAASGAALAAGLGLPWALGALPPLLLILAAPWVWTQLDKLLHVGWLARGMIAVTRAARGEIPEFAERGRAFAGALAEAAREPGLDEILVVSHSMGAQQAGRALGRALIADPDFARGGTPVNFLSLGSLLPFYSMTAEADAPYREEMAALTRADWIGWVDVTGPSDPGCAASLHPLAGLGLDELAGRPDRRSPRFHLLLTPETYRKLKRQPLEFHFHYLKAAEIPGDYDFFRLTTGPEPLTAWRREMAA
ncbi:MAG TPA: hypothetical protein VIJ94_14645 [Caulobacteraceae bacterium]